MPEHLMIVSSDGHIGPPVERYREYMDPKFVADFDKWFNEYIPLWMTKGTMASDSAKELLDANMWGADYQKEFETRAAKIPWGIEGKWDSGKRLEALDIDGVSADVMFPDDQSSNSPPFIGLARDYREPYGKYSHEDRREGARAYNRWLADFCSAAPERLLGTALIGSLANVDDAIETVTWAKENGINGGANLPVHYYNMEEPFWNDKRYDPFWAACQDLDIPLHTHVGQGSPYYGDDPFTGLLLWAMESTFWVHRPLYFMTFGGVFERFPNLKMAFTEQGVDWIAPMLMGMDAILDGKITPFGEDTRRSMYSLKPSEYFYRQCWVGATNTDALGWASQNDLERLGYQKLMWGSDYPHMESHWPHTKETLKGLMKGLPENEVKAMVCDNAVTCYSIDTTKLEATAERVGPQVEDIVAA